MSSDRNFEVDFCGINIGDIIENIYEMYDKYKDDKDIPRQVCNHNILGLVTYTVLDSEIKISFAEENKEFYILKNQIFLMKEGNNNRSILIFTKPDLKEALEKFQEKYEFIVNSEIINDINKILNDLPTKIILRKKEEKNAIIYDVFKPLNKKHEIPKSDFILIDTNELIPRNIFSLGIYRDNKINIVIKKRDELINEIKNFMNNKNEKIMKIFGVDGIGKSLTCIYLSSLRNNFKTIYFNLKEFYYGKSLNNNKNSINIFKSQLISYYTNENNDINKNKADDIYKKRFEFYCKSMENFDKDIAKKNIFSFWKLLEHILEKFSGNIRNKILCIIDQYKLENDEYNELYSLEQKLNEDINMDNIKLLVVSSLNDMGVKNDFIEVLKQCSNKEFRENIEIIGDTKVENDSINEVEDIFKDFSSNINYLEKNEKIDDNFEKIKTFNDIDDELEKNREKKEKPRFNEKILLDKIVNYYSDCENNYKNIYDINKQYRIIYINNLVSIENIEEEENKQIIQKLNDFNYNPKYYNKFKKYFKNNNNLNDAHNNFIFDTYNKIKSKITKFYHDFNNKFKTSLKEQEIAIFLLQLLKLVEEKIELNLNSLIYYLNKFPIKYLKIIKVNNDEVNNFLRLNRELSESKFRIEYAFPFVKFVIAKLLFQYGENRAIHYAYISSNGFDSLFEKVIRKAILEDKIFGNFNSRYVWSLRRFITSRKDDTKTKETKEAKYELKFDFFNLKELTYDDEKNNPLSNYYTYYYIIPNSQNNPILDSMILVPSQLNNEKDKIFDSISLQITIKKKKIYSLEDYHEAASSASKLVENIYNIKIRNKYFTFVLAKEYDNKTTIESLIISRIPFVFFSSYENCFYFDENVKIENIIQLMDNKFKIGDEEIHSIFNKDFIYRGMELLLQKKRNRDNIKITKNLFSFARKKFYNNEKPLILTDEINKKIIDSINSNSYYQKKKIIIEYIFRTKFSRANELIRCKDDLLGVVFYHSKIFLINSKLDSLVTILDEKPKEEYRVKLYDLIFKPYVKESSESIIVEPKFDNLMKYHHSRPSNIFVFLIYEITE